MADPGALRAVNKRYSLGSDVPFTKAAVEEFISKKAAEVSLCGAADMQQQVPDSKHWLANFGLSVMFNDFPPEEMRPFAINLIRRITAAFVEYGLARQEVLELVQDGHGRWSPYFGALNHFEVTISQLYMAMDSVHKQANHKFFESGDRSFEENLNLIHNTSKHQIAHDELPVWFSNSGVHTSKASLSFDEIEDYMLKMAGVVKGLLNREIALQALRDGANT
jgi:hypothetical protein